MFAYVSVAGRGSRDVALPPGWRWTLETKTVLPAFTRCIRRTRPPPAPAGLWQTSSRARKVWQTSEFAYPPYTFDEKYTVVDTEGVEQAVPAIVREWFVGIPPQHTKLLDGKESADEEADRCSLSGNAFHVMVMAWLVGQEAFAKGILDVPPSPKLLRERVDAQWNLSAENVALPEACPDESSMSLALQRTLLARAGLRGSDVRLDTGLPFRSQGWPRSEASLIRWVWKATCVLPFRQNKLHVNVLELKALTTGVK